MPTTVAKHQFVICLYFRKEMDLSCFTSHKCVECFLLGFEVSKSVRLDFEDAYVEGDYQKGKRIRGRPWRSMIHYGETVCNIYLIQNWFVTC